MDRLTAYEDDVYAWSREQADVLRRLAETRRDLPNDLDIANIAEEIEDVGSSELFRVESFLELFLIHLIKIASAPAAPAGRHWQAEIAIQHRSVSKHYRRSMRQKIDLDEIWDRSVARAAAALDEHGYTLLGGLPATCPFDLDELVAPGVDPQRNARWAAILAAAVAPPSP